MAMMKVVVLTDEKKFAGKEGQREACSRGKNKGGVKTALEMKGRHYCRPSMSGEVNRCVVFLR